MRFESLIVHCIRFVLKARHQWSELKQLSTLFIIHKDSIYKDAICPVEWGEISTKQSVGKCKQINF